MFASRIRDLRRSDLTIENLEQVFNVIVPGLDGTQRAALLAAVAKVPVNLVEAAAHLKTPVQMLALEEIARKTGGAVFPDLKAHSEFLRKRGKSGVQVKLIPHADGFPRIYQSPYDRHSAVEKAIYEDWRDDLSLGVISKVHSTEEDPVSPQMAASIIRRAWRKEALKTRMVQGSVTVIDLYDAGLLKWRDMLAIVKLHKANPTVEDFLKDVDFDYNFKGRTGIKSSSARKAFLGLSELLRKKGYTQAADRLPSIPRSQGRFDF